MKDINLTAGKIAELIDGQLVGERDAIITGLNNSKNAKKGELTFIADQKYLPDLEHSSPSLIILKQEFEFENIDNCILIYSDNPYESILKIVHFIDKTIPKKNAGVHVSAVIDKTAKISDLASIGANVVIGRNCKVGKNSIIRENTVLYDNVIIGINTTLNSNITIYDDVEIGDNCIFHAGVVVGSDGFGNLLQKDGSWIKIPQIGNVIIEDNVEVGANTTIDCAFIGSTIIKKGVRLDNLIQIGHNAVIGEHSAFAAHVGIAGSAIVGKRNQFGGQAGMSGHIETADDVVIMAQSGVAQSVKDKGLYFGSPIRSRMDAFRIEASLSKLPDLIKKVKKLEKKIDL